MGGAGGEGLAPALSRADPQHGYDDENVRNDDQKSAHFKQTAKDKNQHQIPMNAAAGEFQERGVPQLLQTHGREREIGTYCQTQASFISSPYVTGSPNSLPATGNLGRETEGIVQHPFQTTWVWEIEEEDGLWTISEHLPPSSIPSRATALMESIAELIENLPMESKPTSIVSSSMAAVCNLSKLKPPLALELESRLLRALLYTIFTMGTGQDTTHFQALHKTYSQSLDSMFRGLLTETPTTDKLQHLLEHVHFWLHSKKTQERARAIWSSAALLRFATTLPGFDVFEHVFTGGQRRTFLQAALLAIHNPQIRVSQAGLVLTYSFLGEASQLIRDEELIENLPMESEPTSIVSSSMAAVCNLSKLKPPLALELESRLLRAVLHGVFTMGTGQDTTHFQALHKTYLRSLDTMFRDLLTETPTTDKLQHLLEHGHFWLHSKMTQERARAIRSSAALLRFATTLPGFDSSSDFPKAGHFVLQLGLYISDPADDISRQARGGVYWLYSLLLQNWGLNIREASELWCWDGLQDTERLAYRNMARVGEVFGHIFTGCQRRTFLQAALLAIHDPQIRVSLAGLVLTYSILEEASQLIGDEVAKEGSTGEGSPGPFTSGP
ncbi:HEAT repeat-containing protein 8 [Chelonia mydas]|uniref:HEAT repeat-containing protein 8 n=1 Tax=Chelonia mydas TaxID=8469 RepID=M7AG56_CHEMY|nr:HEAT repeat-containing protein 8 [Chelonia mydas]